MPVYNVEKYVDAAISSVYAQRYRHWELLIINDGSTDCTALRLRKWAQDRRITCLHQKHKGVSAARNLGLKHMKGDFFCFLDGDDKLFPQSIYHRIQQFGHQEDIWFIDGVICKYNENLSQILDIRRPSQHIKSPLHSLLQLNGKYFTCISWLIRSNEHTKGLYLAEDLHHAEDLYFYVCLAAKGGLWASVEHPILAYRTRACSAMHNLRGLAAGYVNFYQKAHQHYTYALSDIAWWKLWWRIKRVMMLSFLRAGMWQAASQFVLLPKP